MQDALFINDFSRFDEAICDCALINSGSSRTLCLNGHHVTDYLGLADPQISHQLFGDDIAGLGGNHYQANKLVIVRGGADEHSISFRFVQYDAESETVIYGAECSNAATSAAVFALSQQIVVADHNYCIHAYNEGSGQSIRLVAEDPWRFSNGRWRIIFDRQPGFDNEKSVCLRADCGGKTLEFTLVEKGNLFAFVEIPASEIDENVLRGIQESVEQHTGQLEYSAPKIIFFESTHVWANQAWINAVCVFRGQRHRSIPGSAAMCLAGFLAQRRSAAALGTEWLAEELHLNIRHPGGVLTVTVNGEISDGRYQLRNTQIETSVRTLLMGSLFLNNFGAA